MKAKATATAKRPQVLRWVGGKGRVLDDLRPRLPASFGTYFEPFCGGAALFFDLHRHGLARGAVLCDLNVELIDTYAAIAHDVDEVIAQLRAYARWHAADAKGTYYATRSRWNDPAHEWELCERAAAFVYLNRVNFNGLWRVNQKTGAYNVPLGDVKNPTICAEASLRFASAALKTAKLLAGDYRTATKIAKAGDFVYFDSPFVTAAETSGRGFTSYTRSGWRIDDLEVLAGHARELADRGVHVMLSNHDTPTVRELFFEQFWIAEISAPRSVAASGVKRKATKELVVTSYEPEQMAGKEAGEEKKRTGSESGSGSESGGEAQRGRWYTDTISLPFGRAS